jgi:hypothetical protein
VTLVGYTNAGKSSMLNAVTHAGVDVEDRLFVTLDPRTRQKQLPGGETVLFTDTVGFISNLPHELVEAFMSTLNSVQLADSWCTSLMARATTRKSRSPRCATSLIEIGAEHVPELLVFNKADVPGSRAKDLAKIYDGSVWVSAKTGRQRGRGDGVIGERLRSRDRILTLQLPLDRGDLLAAAHREGDVLDTSVNEEGVLIHVVLDAVGPLDFVSGAFRREFRTTGLPLRTLRRPQGIAEVSRAVPSTAPSGHRSTRRLTSCRGVGPRVGREGLPTVGGHRSTFVTRPPGWIRRRFGSR